MDQQSRPETQAQRADRNWVDLLQEFRVLQTGVQLLSGFLLTLPFHSTFQDLDDFQTGTYLALVLLAATTATLLTPIAVHRRLFGEQRKDALVTVAHALTRGVLVLTGALVVGTVFFVFDIVVDRTTALVVGGAVLCAVVGALLVAPFLVARAAIDD